MIAATRDDFRMPALHLQEAPGSDHQHPRHLQGKERSGAGREVQSRPKLKLVSPHAPRQLLRAELPRPAQPGGAGAVTPVQQ